MAIQASLSQLQEAEDELQELKANYPEAYEKMAELVDERRNCGYKNLCKMMMESTTPKELKGID